MRFASIRAFAQGLIVVYGDFNHRGQGRSHSEGSFGVHVHISHLNVVVIALSIEDT